MVGTTTLERALRSSAMLLVAEHRRLREELDELEESIMQMRTGASSATLEAQMAEAEARAAELRTAIADKHAQERAAAAKAAAAAARERLTGHARMLADAHDQKLEAVRRAEAHATAMVEAINEMLQAEALERAAATAMCVEGNIDSTPLQLDGTATLRRIAGNIVSALMQIAACNKVARRLGDWVLPAPDPDLRGESWAAREARHTSESVRLLLAHAEAERTN
jgi:hypothetical protein